MDGSADRVAQLARSNLRKGLGRLADYVSIPAISSDPAHHADVTRLAEKVRDDLRALGLSNARLLTLAGALPAVAAEWMLAGPDKPTVLIYGHLDLQPVKGEAWDTPPHTLTEKGDRVYARGAADDMGGWVSHLLALEAWLTETGALPCNVRLLIEGEEEIGSPNLERYMDAYPEAFASDVMVLTDCENPSVEIPGLTISLRGLLELEVKVRGASCDVHSGLWGNLAPDPALGLMVAVTRLLDAEGRLAVARRPVDATWLEASRSLPLDAETVRKGAHLLDAVAPLDDAGLSKAAWAWRQPAITVLSTTLPAPGTEKNAIRKEAAAKLSLRVAPGQTPEQLFDAVRDVLSAPLPGQLSVEVTQLSTASSWDYQPRGPAFEAANRAYEKAWGRPLMQVGIGGTIPFVALFGRRFGDLPLILNGVIDPETTAHGPNESMHLGVFERAIAANVYLLAELSTLPLSRTPR